MSGVYINMEMPKSCQYCHLRNESDECCLGALLTEYQKRPDDCPIIPVPPHGRLIDADALIKGEGHYLISFGKEGIDIAEINRAPTVIPAQTEKEGQ